MKRFLAVIAGFAGLLSGGSMIFSSARNLDKLDTSGLKPFEKIVEARKEKGRVAAGIALVFVGVASLGAGAMPPPDQNRNGGASGDHPRRKF